MDLQELLDKTNQLISTIQIHHRNTLRLNFNLHLVLGDIKDYLMDFIDTIGEDIVIKGGKADFSVVSVDKKDNRKEIYEDSVEKVEEYLQDLVNFYRISTDDEIQNEYMAKTKEIRKLYNKLISVCPEMEKYDNKEKKELPKPKILMGIK